MLLDVHIHPQTFLWSKKQPPQIWMAFSGGVLLRWQKGPVEEVSKNLWAHRPLHLIQAVFVEVPMEDNTDRKKTIQNMSKPHVPQ